MSSGADRGNPSLARRLISRVTIAVTAVLLALGFFLDRSLEAAFLDDLTHSLVQQATAVAAALPEDEAELQGTVLRLARRLEVRITLIRSDGSVVAESERDPARIESHANRPEVRAALQGRTGVATRRSATVGDPFRYVALPPADGVIVRVALPLSIVGRRLAAVRGFVALGVGLAVLVAILTIALVSRAITRPLERMTASVAGLASGDLTVRVDPGDTAELAVLAGTVNRMAGELERRVAEIRADRATRELILSTMDEGVLLLEDGDLLGYANRAAADLLGPLSREARPAPLPPELADLVREARTSGTVRHAELRPIFSGADVRASAVPVDRDGRILVVLRDVTEARRLERMRRDFVANASHELKTPAASIQASAETVRRAIPDDPDAAARFAEGVEREALRLSSLVSDLLDLSRLEAAPAEREPIRLDHLVAAEADRIRERAAAGGVDVRSAVEPVTFRGSAKDLRLMLSNLLDNAVHHTPGGGMVEVSVATREEWVELSVRDTGVGISSRDLPRVFERFYRVDPARSRATGGTGLGLSIAKHVAEQHGGTISAQSELGQGSTFRVRLPRDG